MCVVVFFFNMSSLLLFYSIFYFSYFSKPNPLKPICLASLMMTTLQMCNTMLNLILCLRHQKLTATFFFFFFVKPSHFNLPSSQWTGNRVESLQIMRYFRPCTTNLFFLSICHLNGKQHNNLMQVQKPHSSVTGASRRKGTGLSWIFLHVVFHQRLTLNTIMQS